MSLKLDVENRRLPRSFTLKPTSIDLLERVAAAYDTNASRIVEAMIVQYGPKLLAEQEKANNETL